MHILLLASYYPSAAKPVTGIFFHKQALALHKAKHKVGVLVTPRLNVTLDHAKEYGWSSLRNITRDTWFTDFPIYRMHWGWFPRIMPFVVAPLMASAAKSAFQAYCREEGIPDIIHAHNTFYAGYAAAKIKTMSGVPAVLTEHSTSFLEGLVILPGQKQIVCYTLENLNLRLAVGKALQQALQIYAPKKPVTVLGNVIDVDFFRLPDSLPPRTPFIFTIISQLSERRKGFDVLFDAFARRFKGKDVRLYVGGDGSLRDELKNMTRSLGIEAQVFFLGQLSTEEVRDLIWQSHVIVSASKIETFAVSIAESLACGKPVIATRSGGPDSYLTDECGILVEPGQTEALADAMSYIIETYDHYSPRLMHDFCAAHFSEAAIVRRLVEIYTAAITVT